MKWGKKLLAVGMLLFGAVGCLASLVGVAAIWWLRGWADDTTTHVLDRVDGVIGRVASRAGDTTQRVNSVRDSLHSLNARVQQRVAVLTKVDTEDAADIDALERQLYAAFDRLSDWLGLLRDSAELVQQIRDGVAASSAFLQADSHSILEVVSAVRRGNEELVQTVELLASVKSHLGEIRANRDVEDHAAQFTSLYARIDGGLGKVADLAVEFETAIQTSRVNMADRGQRMRQGMLWGAVLSTLLCIWIAIAQASLALHGWTLLRT